MSSSSNKEIRRKYWFSEQGNNENVKKVIKMMQQLI